MRRMRLAWNAMTIRTRLIAIAAASLFGACAAPDDVSDTTDSVIVGERCTTVICSQHKAHLAGETWFHELNTDGGTSPVSFLYFGFRSRLLHVVGTEIRDWDG